MKWMTRRVMEKIWLKSYPEGIPAEIQVDETTTLVSLLDETCARFASRPAFRNLGESLAFDELNRMSLAFAAYLQGSLGLRSGDRVAIMMPNLLQYPVVLFGALRAGCTVVNVNPMYTARELRHQMADSGAKVIVVLENFAKTVEEVLEQTELQRVIVTRIGDLFHFPKSGITNFVVKHVRHMVPEWHISRAVRLTDALKVGAKTTLRAVRPTSHDTAFLQYTGGTTGVPKGAVLTHGNLAANVRQTVAWVGQTLEAGKETAIIPLPIYHVFAMTAMLTFFALGATSVLITNPRDTAAFVKELKRTPFSAMVGVNTLFRALLDAPGADAIQARNAKVVVAGGMAVQRSVAEQWHRRFGHPIVEGYGLTETSPIACANRLDIDTYSGGIGFPVPSTEVAIMDDDGTLLAPGQPGEICVRGPQVMKEYWNRPDETAHVLAADGWLKTGDLGVMDGEGFVKVLDRKKDVIIVSGFKVFPNEIEDVVAMLPGVAECAAIADVDETGNEAVKVVIVKNDPALTADAVVAHCRRNLTAYKIPRRVVFRDTPMPKSNIGKILRRVVREEEGSRLAPTQAA